MPFYGQYTGFGGGGGDEQNFYQDLVDLDLTSNLRLVFDAGSSESYDGSSQTWTNLVTAEEDAWRGADDSATTDDPTFNGTSGNLSSSEYFSYDGGDHHRLKSSPSWLDSFHKNNAKLTIVLWAYAVAGSGDRGFVGNEAVSAGPGFALGMRAAETLRFSVNVGGAFDKISDSAVTLDTWKMFSVAIDEAAGAGGFLRQDKGYMQVGSADTWDTTYSSPSTSAAAYALDVGTRGDAEQFVTSTTRIAGLMMWDTNLTIVNLDAIFDKQTARLT